jgi:hypothetical protein
MNHPLYDLPQILADGPEALTLVKRSANHYHHAGCALSFVFRTPSGTHLEATFRPNLGLGTIALRAAPTLTDLSLSHQPAYWKNAFHLGSLEHAMPDADPFCTYRWNQPPFAGWLEEDGAPARRLCAALETAIGPRARARADAMVALAKAVALREGVNAGILRPFLKSGPRFRIDEKVGWRNKHRLVGVFRSRVKGAGSPPDLEAFAGTARIWRVTPHSLSNQPTLSCLSSLDVQIPAEESRHERMAWRLRAIEAFAAEDHDITPWLLA